MINEVDIHYKILVNMNKLYTIKKTINEELDKIVKKNYKEYGYLNKIIKIHKYEVKNISKNDFKSNIFIDIDFKGEFINPNIDSIIDCKITDNNGPHLFGLCHNNVIKVIIKDEEEEQEVDNKTNKVGDIVKVKILAKQIKLNDNFINVVCSIVK